MLQFSQLIPTSNNEQFWNKKHRIILTKIQTKANHLSERIFSKDLDYHRLLIHLYNSFKYLNQELKKNIQLIKLGILHNSQFCA